MMITEEALIKALDERGIPISKRVLTDWRQKHYLPPLQARGRGQRRGKIYYWTDSDLVERAVMVDELLCDDFKGTSVNLLLWLFGYEMPLHIVRDVLLAGIEKLEHGMTGGKRSADDIGDYISKFVYDYRLVVERVNRKYPGLGLPPIRDPAGMEKFMNLMANPSFDLDDFQFIETAYALEEDSRQADNQQAPSRVTESTTTDEELRSGRDWLRQHFSLTELKASLLCAGDKELCKAQEDVHSLITSAGRFLSKRAEADALKPEKYQIVYRLGSAMTLIDLSLRRAALGSYIDTYLAQFNEALESFELTSE